MLTKIVYNCNPESLDGIEQAAFVDAFENVVRAKPHYRDLEIEVTFNLGKSDVEAFSSDDYEADISHEPAFLDEFAYYAEKAFEACNAIR